jgi:hypothetical protein
MTPKARLLNFLSRHRLALRDLGFVAVFAAIGMTLAYWIDIFPNEGGAGPRYRTIELDEALLVGSLTLLMGLLMFAWRYCAQQQEMRRRIAAEAEVRKLAFQDALTGLPNRRQFDDALKAALTSPPRSPGMHGRYPDHSRQLRYWLLDAVSPTHLQARQDKDRPRVRHRDELGTGKGALGQCAGRFRAGARSDHCGRWNRDVRPERAVGAERLPAGPGPVDQCPAVGCRDGPAVREPLPTHPAFHDAAGFSAADRPGRRGDGKIVDCASADGA